MSQVLSFLEEHGVELALGITALVFAYLSLRLSRRENQLAVEEVLGRDRQATLFLSRDSMAKAVVQQYRRAKPGDVIWGQCIGCDDYTPEVGQLIIDAAAKGVKHQLIANRYAPTLSAFQELFAPLRTAEVVVADDNSIRLQGLSSSEVIISIPELTQYTALAIRDPQLVGVIREWFDRRFKLINDSNQSLDPR